MKNRILYFFIGLCVLTFMESCQTEIEVDLPDYESHLVVEGYIENGKPAMVILTRSIPYFQHINLNYILNDVIVKDAIVTVTSSDGETERLSLGMSDESPVYFAYMGHNPGRINTDYTLKIEWQGKTYTATTKILEPFDIDSIGFYHNEEIMPDTMRTVRVLMTDNPTREDFYQYLVKVHGRNIHDRVWITSTPVAFDDVTISGLSLNLEVLRSNPSAFLMPEMSEEALRNYYRMTYIPGDTIYVKHCLIDYNSYQYWTTGGTNAAYGQNPFMNPAPVISNIQGASGVWCGYAAKIDTLIYPIQTETEAEK